MKTADIIIAEYRKKNGISQSDLAKHLTVIGYPTTNKMVSSWEKGTAVPNANQYLAICEILNINNFSINDLTIEGQYKVADYINTLMQIDKYRTNKRQLPYYNVAVSAGTGQYIDDCDYEMVAVGDEVPLIADYGVRIAGDSMEPLIHDGDVLWVESTQQLKVGDIGIFCVDGEVYCKVLSNNMLLSLNSKYSPIQLNELSSFKILGKVVK